jgi:hypothetical protein
VLLWTARREERRLAAGHTYEPPTIIERRNWTWANPVAINPVATNLVAINPLVQSGGREAALPMVQAFQPVPALTAQAESSGS